VPIGPNDLQEEPEDVEEHYEPNPKNLPPPKVVEEVVAEPVEDDA
jgi:hypothetical protein